MNKLIFLALLLILSSAYKTDALSSLWDTWKTHHKKGYSALEERVRFGIFVENYQKITRLNAENIGVKFGLNKFADLTSYEFGLRYASGGLSESNQELLKKKTVTSSLGNLPVNVDWRNKGAVTPVGDQFQCGSCWAFSTLGLLEAFYFVKNGQLIAFSEQQLMDCDTQSYGCNGGYPDLAVDYATKAGLESNADYPYTGVDANCLYDQSKTYNMSATAQYVKPNSTDQMKAALVNSPVSIVIDAFSDPFQFYKSGVIRKNCTADQPNHTGLAVGYDKFGLYEAFIVKNSWGTDWGMDGYVLIGTSDKENKGLGPCGVLFQPMIVVPKENSFLTI